MLTNFKELEDYVLSRNMKKRIALANAHDEPALSAVVHAHRKGVVDGTLVGKKNEIIAMLHDMGENESDYEIVDFDGEELEAAKIAVQLVREGKADIPMKGILQTSNFARAILNKETGLIPKGGRRLVSQCGIFEYEGRFIMITDAAINIAPDVETQIGIVENALPVARALGVECPKVAVLSAVENVTDKMPSTVTAREIAERGVEGCVISAHSAPDTAGKTPSAAPPETGSGQPHAPRPPASIRCSDSGWPPRSPDFSSAPARYASVIPRFLRPILPHPLSHGKTAPFTNTCFLL